MPKNEKQSSRKRRVCAWCQEHVAYYEDVVELEDYAGVVHYLHSPDCMDSLEHFTTCSLRAKA